MNHPTDDTTRAKDLPAEAGAASDGGWRRWMPRRRTGPAPAGAPAADEPAENASSPQASAGDVASAPGESPPASSAAPPGAGSARRWMPRRRITTPPAAGNAEPPTGSNPAAEAPGEAGAATDETAAGEPVTAATAADGVGRLRRRRKRLLSEREVTVYHLGGLAFELYRHDRLHPEVMQRRAGEIALIDETVHDIDLRLEQLATDRRNRRTRDPDPRTPVGNCVSCRAPFQVDARFCWQCGTQLVRDLPDPPKDVDLDEQTTQTIRRPAP